MDNPSRLNPNYKTNKELNVTVLYSLTSLFDEIEEISRNCRYWWTYYGCFSSRLWECGNWG